MGYLYSPFPLLLPLVRSSAWQQKRDVQHPKYVKFFKLAEKKFLNVWIPALYHNSSYHVSICCTLCIIFYVHRVGNLLMGDHFQLIDEEAKLIDLLNMYIETENIRLEYLQNYKDQLIQSGQLYTSEDEFAWNPLAIYKTVKYLTFDLNKVKKNMTENNYDVVIAKMPEKEIVPLEQKSLYDEIRHLTILKQAYNLTVADMIDGHLVQNVTVEPALTVNDCLNMGKICFERNDYPMTIDWLLGCHDKFDDDMKRETSDLLIRSGLYVGDIPLTSSMIRYVLNKDVSHRTIIDLDVTLAEKSGSMTHHQLKNYHSQKACAGDFEDEVLTRNLKCRYNHHNSFFLTIAPLKEEILSFEPKVSLFREVIYDSEIEILKEDASVLFEPATVLTKGIRTLELRYRPSLVAFLYRISSPKYHDMFRRLSDMTSLSMKYSENFQMLHYAPGAYYRVHSDFLWQCYDCEETGNRIATVLMYLNDVTLGGETIFPHLKLTVQPAKGSALFWMNMHKNKSQDMMTEHAACPVIYGEKMVCTEWFRANGQPYWIAEPRDDKMANYTFNEKICRLKRKRIA